MPQRLLLVEDERYYARKLDDVLRPAGFVVTTADGVGQAQEAVMESPPDAFDAALLDIMMRGLPELGGPLEEQEVYGGIQFLRWLRRQRPGLPVVMVTKVGSAARQKQCADLGVVGYHVKGGSPDELLSLVRQAVGQAR